LGFEKGAALKRFVLAFWLGLGIPARGMEDAKILPALKAKLKGHGDLIERTVQRVGDKTLEIESFLSMEGDFTTFGKIAGKVHDYPTWILHKINDKPDGGTYPVKITDLQKVVGDPFGLVTEMKLDFPLIKKTLFRKMRFVPEVTPERVRVVCEMPELDDSMLSSGTATLTFFPAEGETGRIWGYIVGRIKIRNWLLYEALPTRILKREAGERFNQVIYNYQAEEIRQIRSNQSPKGKTAAQGE
jgi:hypothetical protein